jgi:hypothetical protein
MRAATCLALALFASAGCAPITVSAHIERGVSFAGYETYDWGPAANFPVGDPRLDNNSFFVDYLMGAIEKGMAAKGYAHSAGAPPDLLIHYHASVTQKVDVYTTEMKQGATIEGYEPRMTQYEQGTIVVDIVDASTGQLLWRGWSQGVLDGVIDNQARLERQVEDGVARLMALLPQGATMR